MILSSTCRSPGAGASLPSLQPLNSPNPNSAVLQHQSTVNYNAIRILSNRRLETKRGFIICALGLGSLSFGNRDTTGRYLALGFRSSIRTRPDFDDSPDTSTN